MVHAFFIRKHPYLEECAFGQQKGETESRLLETRTMHKNSVTLSSSAPQALWDTHFSLLSEAELVLMPVRLSSNHHLFEYRDYSGSEIRGLSSEISTPVPDWFGAGTHLLKKQILCYSFKHKQAVLDVSLVTTSEISNLICMWVKWIFKRKKIPSGMLNHLDLL